MIPIFSKVRASATAIQAPVVAALAQVYSELALPNLRKFDACAPIVVGPDDPRKTFYPALFSTAVDLYRAAESSGRMLVLNQERDEKVIAACVVKTFLDLNIAGFSSDPKTEIRLLLSKKDGKAILHINKDLYLDFAVQNQGAADSIFLGLADAHPTLYRGIDDFHPHTSPLENYLKGEVQRQLASRVSAGHPALLFPGAAGGEGIALRGLSQLLLAATRNSPYNETLQEREAGSKRFAFINLLHSWRRDGSGTEELLTTLRERPAILAIPGWCGGTVLHEAAEFGNVRLMEGILKLAKEHEPIRDIVNRRSLTFQQLLSLRNRDGDTPLHLANFEGHTAAKELLLSVGADPGAMDRFGNPAVETPVNISTARLHAEQVNANNYHQFLKLFDQIFAASEYSPDREIVRIASCRLGQSSTAMPFEGRQVVAEKPLLWSSGKEIVGLSGLYYEEARPNRAWLSYLGVQPTLQRRGFGEEILQASEKEAIAGGAKKLFVLVSESGGEALHNFYRRAGFKRIIEKQIVRGFPFSVFLKNLD